MLKVILNTGKHLEILSNGGKYKLVAKMKVDYDSFSGTFGARDWIFKVVDIIKKQNVNLQKDGEDIFKNIKYQYKKDLLKAKKTEIFSIAISEMEKNGVAENQTE